LSQNSSSMVLCSKSLSCNTGPQGKVEYLDKYWSGSILSIVTLIEPFRTSIRKTCTLCGSKWFITRSFHFLYKIMRSFLQNSELNGMSFSYIRSSKKWLFYSSYRMEKNAGSRNWIKQHAISWFHPFYSQGIKCLNS
jgi:hypothetical protein